MRWFRQPMSHSQLLNNPSINLLSSVLRYPKYSKFQRLKLSVTGDTANRLDLHSAEVCTLYPQESFPPLSLRTAWCLKTGRTKQGLPKSSSGPLPVPIQSYRSSTSRSTVRPESRLGSTKPEPIMACGCTGKLPVNGVSIRLFVAGWSFPQDVMALLHASRPSAGFSRVPVNRPPPSSEFWSPSWAWSHGVVIILTLTSPLWITQPTPSTSIAK